MFMPLNWLLSGQAMHFFIRINFQCAPVQDIMISYLNKCQMNQVCYIESLCPSEQLGSNSLVSRERMVLTQQLRALRGPVGGSFRERLSWGMLVSPRQ